MSGGGGIYIIMVGTTKKLGVHFLHTKRKQRIYPKLLKIPLYTENLHATQVKG